MPVPARPLRLQNTMQRYDWGSPDAIPNLLRIKGDGAPMAELWLGAHPSAPSITILGDDDSARVDLATLIQQHPVAMLGQRVADEYGPRLPYLLKILAAGKALSLQVHPSPHQAREGFNAENAAGVPLGSPERSFHDDQHKPEMIIALTPFEALAGFRAPRQITRLLAGLDGNLVASVRRHLTKDRSAGSMRAAFQLILSARNEPNVQTDIDATIASVRRRLRDGSGFEVADQTVLDLADQHPGDPGAIASLMLNRITLQPGESFFIGAGEIHAYLSGMGIEIMASSDNVLRAGLTSKMVDAETLVRLTSFRPQMPVKPTLTHFGQLDQGTHYRPPVSEFAISIADANKSEELYLPATGPRIVLCYAGKLKLRTPRAVGSDALVLEQGQSVFVPDAAGPITLLGDGKAVCAWVP